MVLSTRSGALRRVEVDEISRTDLGGAEGFARRRGTHRGVQGVTAAATGAIAGAALVLGRRAVVDVQTFAIALGTLGAIVYARRLPEPPRDRPGGGRGAPGEDMDGEGA
jgi:hypothetical protein